MPTVPSEELDIVIELLRARPLSQLSLEEQRAVVETSAGSLPEGTEVVAVDSGGVASEWVTAPGADVGWTVVALRGGGYCLGSLTSNRRFSALLSQHAGARVLNVGYRNAPEHRYPAALDDAVAAYRWLLATGTDPATVVLCGNSAGGGLALACLLALRDAGDPAPSGAVAMSPWTDLAATGESVMTNAPTELMLDPDGVLDTARMYADDAQLTDPYVSPLYGDLHGLPPLLLHVSGAEILRDDTLRFADKAQGAGVRVTVDVVDRMPHVWHLFAGFLPEADAAFAQVGEWVLDRRASRVS
jgi:epsilon-lactone hydrolase